MSGRRPRLDLAELERASRRGGMLAGLAGGLAAAAFVVLSALASGEPLPRPFAERAELFFGLRSPLLALLAQLGAAALLGLVFARLAPLRSGLALALRGLAFGAALWVAAALAALALGGVPAPSPAEGLVYGAALGTQAWFTRALLLRRWGAA